MKNKILTVLTIFLGLCAPAHANLELLPEYSLIPTSADAKEVVLDLRVYIKNLGNVPESIAVGEIVDVSYGNNVVVFNITLRKTARGEKIKPSTKMLDMVTLNGGEVAMLGSLRIPIRADRKFYSKVVYVVSRDLAAIYPVWSGTLEADIGNQPRPAPLPAPSVTPSPTLPPLPAGSPAPKARPAEGGKP